MHIKIVVMFDFALNKTNVKHIYLISLLKTCLLVEFDINGRLNKYFSTASPQLKTLNIIMEFEHY